MFHERHSRTIAKSITWRIIAFASTIIVVYLLTHDWEAALYHSIVIHAVKTVLYYFHERAWNASNFGQEIRSQ